MWDPVQSKDAPFAFDDIYNQIESVGHLERYDQFMPDGGDRKAAQRLA